MRGVTSSGSTYGGIIFAISIYLELGEPACLCVILVLPPLEIARNRNAASTVEGRMKWVGGKQEVQTGDADFP